MGGGFGIKAYLYPEAPVVLWASKLVGHPVRWTATRGEAMVTDTHAHDLVTRTEMAFDDDGQILALRCETVAAYGAYQSTFAPLILAGIYANLMTGLYRTPVAHVSVEGVFTNTTPVDAYRGAAAAPTFVNERLIEKGAREMGIDPAELRLRNYIHSRQYPYTNPLGYTYDSGDPPGQQELMLGIADYRALRDEQRRLRVEGVRMGIGMAGFLESAGMGPSRMVAEGGSKVGGWESANLRVHPDGKVTMFVGTHSHGQGHEITYRQVAAECLGLDIGDIDFTQGDTDMGPGNFGTGAARSISTAGIAIVEAAERVIAKATKLAAHLMECADEDVVYENGVFSIKGTDRQMRFAEVAEMAYYGADYPEQDFALGLDETAYYDPTHFNYPTALHLAVVIVDAETGAVALRDYFAVDDAGRLVHPLVV